MNICFSGLGIASAIGQGQSRFTQALLNGESRFAYLERPGRLSDTDESNRARYVGAELNGLEVPATIPARVLRTLSLSGEFALSVLDEAWNDAGLEGVDPARIGLIIGGSNVQQRSLVNTHNRHRGKEEFLSARYGLAFMDSDLCGLCTEHFGISGYGCTVGGASASGQLAVIQAIQAVESGLVDVCIGLGAMMDLSYWECQGFRALRAMGSDRFSSEPAAACRPFDLNHDGFIYGESCAAVVVESKASAEQRQVTPYATCGGWAVHLDSNRNPNPSLQGETAVLKKVLDNARLTPDQIDYVNPHGTSSIAGDITELEALAQSDLHHAYLNATKSITGHGLSAAGAVEIVATLLQIRQQRLHPTLNLDEPIDRDFNWVGSDGVVHTIRNALNISIGFGGINTALCLQAA